MIIGRDLWLQARRHSGCMTLPGVQLESSGGGGTAGSHMQDEAYFGCATAYQYSVRASRPTASVTS